MHVTLLGRTSGENEIVLNDFAPVSAGTVGIMICSQALHNNQGRISSSVSIPQSKCYGHCSRNSRN